MPEGAQDDVAKVVEISAKSPNSFEDALQRGLDAMGKDLLPFVSSAWVKEQRVEVDDGQIAAYQVNLLITYLAPKDKPPQW